MKRIIFVVIASALLLGLSIPVTAFSSEENGFESLQHAEEFEQIKSLSGEVVQEINQCLNLEYGEDTTQISQEDLHWDEAYKIYTEVNVFETGSDSTVELFETLKSGHCVWKLPIRKDGVFVTVTFSHYGPLPENAEEIYSPTEYAREAARQNKWGINSVGFPTRSETDQELFTRLLQENQLPADSHKVIIGGFSKLRSAIGITMNDETVESVVILQQPALTGEPKTSFRRSSQITELEEGKDYDFKALASYMQGVPEPSGTGAGGGGGTGPNFDLLIPGTLLGTLILFIAGIVLMTCLSRKRRGN